MVQDYKYLHPSKLEAGAGYHYPGVTPLQPVSVDSPAIDVMTDLRLVAAATIDSDVSIDAANQAMIARGVRSLLVVDGQGSVIGIITARDIHGERPMQVVHKRGVRHGEVKVGDVMTRREDIEVLDLSEVLRARVGAVIDTLKRSGRQHALVADRDKDDRQMVRGIFSLSQIARQLGVPPMHTTEVARTFAEIEAAISEAPAS
ncbi:MAG TPA: CBS domain-containing protein [Rhodocyclaceae bacterium]|nr:CBS domain-containing protein [Rhodocyclaceae bacterium]